MSTVTCVPCKIEQLPKAFVVSLAGSCCCCCTSKKDACGDCKGEGSEAGKCTCGMFNGYFTLTERSSCQYVYDFENSNKCGAKTLELTLTKAEYPEGQRFNACVKITFKDEGGKKVRPAAWGKTGLKKCCNIGVLRRRATNRKCCWPKTVTVSPKPVPDFVAPQPHWHPGNPEDLNDAPFWPTLDVDLKEDSDLAPIRYANGELQLRTRDIEADGFGVPWGHTRIYSNRLSNSYDFGQGTNWLILQNPYLVEQKNDPAKLQEWGVQNATGCTIVMVRGTRNSLWFDQVKKSDGSKSWRARFGAMHELTIDEKNHHIEIAAPNGHLWEFHDFCCKRENLKEAPRGAFYRHSGTGDQKIYTAYKNCRLTQVWRQADSAISPPDGSGESKPIREVFSYRYIKEGENKGRIQYVTHFRMRAGIPDEDQPLPEDSQHLTTDVPEGSVQRSEYLYCDSNRFNSHGKPGDLKMAAQQILEDGSWKNESIHYYRYKTEALDTYCQGLLECAVGPEAFRRMINLKDSVNEPNFSQVDFVLRTIADGDLKLLASLADTDPLDNINNVADVRITEYGERNGDERRVKEISTQGGLLALKYGYSKTKERTGEYYYNEVKMTTEESRPDNSKVYVLSTDLGRNKLNILVSDTGKNYWMTYRSYDIFDGDLNKVYNPSSLIHPPKHQDAMDKLTKPGRNYNLFSQGIDGNISIFEYGTKEAGIQGFINSITGSNPSRFLSYVKCRNMEGQGAFVPYHHPSHGDLPYVPATEITLKSYKYTRALGSAKNVHAMTRDVTHGVAVAGDESINKTESFSYDKWVGRAQVGTVQNSLPPISSNHNRIHDNEATTIQVFDLWGNEVSRTDVYGAKHSMSYRIETGALKQRKVTYRNQPGPLSKYDVLEAEQVLTYDYQSDEFGRITEEAKPEAFFVVDKDSNQQRLVRPASWTVYKDIAGEIRQASGYIEGKDSDAKKRVIEPVKVTKYDRAGREADIVVGQRQGNQLPQNLWCRWTSNEYNDQGQLVKSLQYVDIKNKEAAETKYYYSPMNRIIEITSPGGTITRTQYDVRGLLLSTSVGMEPYSESRMTKIELREYDGSNGSSGGCGNLTKIILPCDDKDSGTKERIFKFDYDWRNYNTQLTLPNLQTVGYDRTTQGQIVEAIKRSNDRGVLYRKETRLDNRGRVYREIVHGVIPGTFQRSGRVLVHDYWLNDADQIVRDQPPGSGGFTHNIFNQLGQLIRKEAVIPDQASGTYPTNNRIPAAVLPRSLAIQSTSFVYDSIGNIISQSTNSIDRDVNANNQTDLMYYDPLGRLLWTINLGNSDPVIRDNEIPFRLVWKGEAIASGQEYNTSGELALSIDPANRITRYTYDKAGRLKERIENSAIPSARDWKNYLTRNYNFDFNRITKYKYNLEGLLISKTLKDPSRGDCTTEYVYQLPPGDRLSIGESAVATSQLLKRIVYPDQSQAEFIYNAQGQVIARKDASGVIHQYKYDNLGRLRNDAVVNAVNGNEKDGIYYDYNERGLLSKIHYGWEIERRDYDDFDQVSSVRLSTLNSEPLHSWSGFNIWSAGRELLGIHNHEIKYQYSKKTNCYNLLEKIIYPETQREESIVYDELNRPVAVPAAASYGYLGMNRLCSIDYQNGIRSDSRYELRDGVLQTSYKPFPALDDFSRVKDKSWFSYTRPLLSHEKHPPKVSLEYNYTPTSRIRSCLDQSKPKFSDSYSEVRSYDQLDRDASYRRGEAVKDDNNNSVTISDAKLRLAQQWNQDSGGNWLEFDEYKDKKWTLQQIRVHSKTDNLVYLTLNQEEFGFPPFSVFGSNAYITTAMEQSAFQGKGDPWATPSTNNLGNLTRIPAADNPAVAQDCKYDSWNRLIEVSQGGKKLVQYFYDGLGRVAVKSTFDAEGKFQRYQRYLYDLDGNLIQESEGEDKNQDLFVNFKVKREYIWGPHGLICRVDLTGAEPNRHYALQDAEGNIAALVDKDQQVVERFKYDPHGRVEFLDSNYVPRTESSFDWNLLWQTGHRDPITGIYLGGDGAYHERLGRSLNPQSAMAQTEADFEENYQKAIATADPSTFNLLQPPPPPPAPEREGLGFWGIAGSIAIGIGVGIAAAALLPATIAVAGSVILGGMASGLFEYEYVRRANGENFNLGSAMGATLLGGALGWAGGVAFKALGWVAKGIGSYAMTAGRGVLRGGRAIGNSIKGILIPSKVPIANSVFDTAGRRIGNFLDDPSILNEIAAQKVVYVTDLAEKSALKYALRNSPMVQSSGIMPQVRYLHGYTGDVVSAASRLLRGAKRVTRHVTILGRRRIRGHQVEVHIGRSNGAHVHLDRGTKAEKYIRLKDANWHSEIPRKLLVEDDVKEAILRAAFYGL